MLKTVDTYKNIFPEDYHTYHGYGWVFAIVDTKEGSKLQQKFRTHWCIAMNPGFEADLWLRWFGFIWFVRDFQGPNGSELYTLPQTGNRR